MSLWIIFLTGLTTGGLTCLAVQGGLLAGVIANREEGVSDKNHVSLSPVISFVIAKLISYTILGFVLGLFGSLFQLSLQWRIFFQLLAGLYMLATAANLLSLHPIFRYVVLQPPKHIYKYLRDVSKTKDIFASGLIGFSTILIPCGTTLAMEVLAMSSGNAFAGASIMAVFVLGTIPLFVILGFSALKLGEIYREKFYKITAILVFILGTWSINGVLNLIGSPVTFETIGNEIVSTLTVKSVNDSQGIIGGEVQEISINVTGGGYLPSVVTVSRGKKVKMSLVTHDNYSCTSSFVFPKFQISKELPPTGTTVIEFTPTEAGTFRWTCGMGMFSGTMTVI
jgi:sulfite exporter TauE/SafE